MTWNEISDFLSGTFGGKVTVLAALGFLFTTLIRQMMKREFHSFSVRNSIHYQKQAEIISELYASIADLKDVIGTPAPPDSHELPTVIVDALAKCRMLYLRNRILFDKKLSSDIAEVLSLFQRIGGAMFFLQQTSSIIPSEQRDAHIVAMKRTEATINKALHALEVKFNRILTGKAD